MKKTFILLVLALVLMGCHKDKEMDIKEAVVSHEEITVSATQARFSWQVDFVGQFHAGVEVSQNESMSDLRRVEATKEEDGFVAVVDSLSVGKKYYYRIVVWNKFSSYEQPVSDFTTSKTFSIHVSAEPSSGGTVTGGGTFAEGDTCTVVASANVGYNFVNWTENGTQVSTEAEYPFVVAGNRDLVANFVLQVSLPTVLTVMVTDITQTTATGGGNITSNGGASIIERGICWSVEPQPTVSDSHFYSGTGIGYYYVPMSNLIPGTTYFVRAYAINSGGIAYGDEVSFTTLSE